MSAPTPVSLVNHLDVLLYLLVILAGAGIGETLRRLSRMEKKQDEQVMTHNNCRETLMRKEDFLVWFETWKKGRDDLWKVLNYHKHDSDGRVTRL